MPSLESKRVLVTGGAGFIGSHLCERLLKLGAEVLCLDNLSSGRMEYLSDLIGNPRFEFKKRDIVRKSDVDESLSDIDIVFHLAARVGVKHYVEDPLDVIRTNIYGTHNLLEASFGSNVERFVFASTSEVYGKNRNVPLREDSDRVLGPPAIDRWCYSSAKAVDEHLCHAYFRRHRLPVVILRYFNIYGPHQDSSDYGGVVSIFIRRVLKGQPPMIHGDGNQTRCFTYVDDAIEATLQASVVDKSIGETLNIGSMRETNINSLAELIVALCGLSGQIGPKHIPYRDFYGPSYEDIPRRVPDTTKAQAMLGVTAGIELEAGLRKTIDWYKKSLEV